MIENVGRGVYSPFFPLQNTVCFIILTYSVPVLFKFYIQGVLKLKKYNSGAERLMLNMGGVQFSNTTVSSEMFVDYKLETTCFGVAITRFPLR